jgi:integrase
MLKLYPPRKGSSSWRIRGTHGFGNRRFRVDISARARDRKTAETNLREVANQIDAGTWGDTPASGEDFASAAMSYMQTSGNERYVPALIRHFGETPWREIDQEAIDRSAAALRPAASPATRNRTVYTPLAAILHHKNPSFKVRRPPGSKGKSRTDYLNPDDAMGIIQAAEGINGDFGLLLSFLLYTGCRLGEALALQCDDLHVGTAYIRESKNDDPRTVRLRADLAGALEARRKAAGPVFPFRYGGRIKELLKRATCIASGVEWRKNSCGGGESRPAQSPLTDRAEMLDGCPKSRLQLGAGVAPGLQETRWRVPPHRLKWVNFHTFRHTWATWMRRYGGADVDALVATGNWRDRRSAARYSHVHAHEVWEAVELFPSMKRREG